MCSFENVDGMVQWKNAPKYFTCAEAINLSIEKWKFIKAECVNGNIIRDGGQRTCALCLTFIMGDCKGCPVAAKGHKNCVRTPYYEYHRKLYYKDSLCLAEIAQEEIDFLESLK